MPVPGEPLVHPSEDLRPHRSAGVVSKSFEEQISLPAVVGRGFGLNSQELQKPFFQMSGSLAKSITDDYGDLADRALKLYGGHGSREHYEG